ncbi:hypothetical protein EJ05DRAFT_290516 [Pseudovirgaria hyperparasitica]|uniref:Transcription factor domain-containing protein n=1 Tax=Pseudovirgaria hyperparasitica TaxID=470096 RepID=A0A6A6WD24_9PEZI|nr:uncharacterized protein EJ05DRAFT_290516 [Pseudovirgaria hyperparasitica]KAF2760603.1 hypothetical protein EJ05DRAFT_290516 [Pseudovirgaria hyperparasitica]
MSYPSTKYFSNIRENARLAWAKLPKHLHYTDTIWETNDVSNANLTLLVCYLNFVYNEFMILRILTKNVGISNVELLQLAMKILSELTTVTKKRNYVNSEGNVLSRDFPWLLLSFGLPVAGVLTTELRNCTISNTPLDKSIPRSTLIRNLSVLIGCLEWLPEPHKYYSLCKDASEKLGSMLDEALDYEHQHTYVRPNTDDVAMDLQDQNLAMTGIDPNLPMDSEAFLAWLESVDWNTAMPTL